MNCFISETSTCILTADEKLFLTLNGLHGPFWDNVMWGISDIPLLGVIYVLIALSLFYHRPKLAAFVAFVFIWLAVGTSDFVCASLIRPAVARMRPSNPDNPISCLVHTLNGCHGGKYGFPSCHAANTFALTVFYCLYRRKRLVTVVMLGWTLIVCYSRIYLGVHYPGDLVCGAIIGTLIAIGYYYLMKLTLKSKLVKHLGFIILIVIFSSVSITAHADETRLHLSDSISTDSIAFEVATKIDTKAKKVNPYKFRPIQLAIPLSLIGIGALGTMSDWFEGQNHEIRDELQEHNPKRLTLDDFTQYAPTLSVYALDLCGVKGLHEPVDQTIILATAALLMGGTVYTVKRLAQVQRPDGSSFNSFPSGHTATAFMGAEFLRREYWKVSPWIGVAGYAVAAGTGFFRMYNNRHWFSDVIAGAGIGILSVEAAYWLYPIITKAIFKKRYRQNIYLAPYASNREKGLSLSVVF